MDVNTLSQLWTIFYAQTKYFMLILNVKLTDVWLNVVYSSLEFYSIFKNNLFSIDIYLNLNTI